MSDYNESYFKKRCSYFKKQCRDAALYICTSMVLISIVSLLEMIFKGRFRPDYLLFFLLTAIFVIIYNIIWKRPYNDVYNEWDMNELKTFFKGLFYAGGIILLMINAGSIFHFIKTGIFNEYQTIYFILCIMWIFIYLIFLYKSEMQYIEYSTHNNKNNNKQYSNNKNQSYIDDEYEKEYIERNNRAYINYKHNQQSDSNHNKQQKIQISDNIKKAFNILELDENADCKTIKERWKTLMLIYHPDKNNINKLASDFALKKSEEVNNAYQIIKEYLRC